MIRQNMTDPQPHEIPDLEHHILEQKAFAVYRLPGAQTPCFLSAGEVALLHDLEELDRQSGFVIAPFHTDAAHPVALLRGEAHPLPTAVPAAEETAHRKEEHRAPAADYALRFEKFASALHAGCYDKLVLSRSITLQRDGSISLMQTFLRACARYPDAYVFVCYTPQTGVWLGCTPEIILSGDGREWCVVALAGTQPASDRELPRHWSDKNREEQAYVAAYIRDLLLRAGYTPSAQGPYTVRAGRLAHLKTEFRFTMPDNTRLGSLLRRLHPTPAVCGLPKEQAWEFILRNEGYDREYYSGFVGMLSPAGRTDLYVNLRCMKISDNSLQLFAGGGLIVSSELDDEWQETENKLQTMRSII